MPPTPPSNIPTLRSLEDLDRPGISIEQVFNLNVLYGKAIDNSLEETVARQGEFHPSDAGSCKRKVVLAFTCVPPTDKYSKALQEIFLMGHAVHDIVQSTMERVPEILRRENGLQCEVRREVPVDKATDRLWREYRISGTCDILLRIWCRYFEQRGIVEIKSSGDERFKAVAKAEQAWEHHLMQSHLYAYRFDCPIIWPFYYNKNQSTREVKTMFFDVAIFDQAIGYFETCMDYVKRGEVPAREESWFECRDCVYRSMCDPKVLAEKTPQLQSTKSLIKRRRRA